MFLGRRDAEVGVEFPHGEAETDGSSESGKSFGYTYPLGMECNHDASCENREQREREKHIEKCQARTR